MRKYDSLLSATWLRLACAKARRPSSGALCRMHPWQRSDPGSLRRQHTSMMWLYAKAALSPAGIFLSSSNAVFRSPAPVSLPHGASGAHRPASTP